MIYTFIRKSGDYSIEVTPVPISNTAVKLFCAEDTWWEAAWKNRSLPVFFVGLHGQAVKTPPFHGGNPGSIPGGVTIFFYLKLDMRDWRNWQTH